jgi:SAM-dependent methyltransferase
MKNDSIGIDSLVDLVFHLKWDSHDATHTDVYHASQVNIWRDILPPSVLEEIMGKQPGDCIQFSAPSMNVAPTYHQRLLLEIGRDRFNSDAAVANRIEPAAGRFYPQGMLKGLPNIFEANVQPFRCVALNNGHLTADLNHPLAGVDVALSAIIGKIETKDVERGGTSMDWMEILTNGPGMQARWRNRPSQFFTENAFNREDASPDGQFYRHPRFVQHLDDTAIDVIKNLYGRFLRDGMQVLDLMASWQSHLPEMTYQRVAGLGLNAGELAKNSQLTEAVIHDLNADFNLPFASNSFDAAVCTVSIEYLIDPLAVFSEVSRVLRRDGYFIVTFSNRWFPTKAVQIWTELHEFERMGLILELFMRSNAFHQLHTYSMRALPRPIHDPYASEFRYSDPVYAVWGRNV